MKTRISVLLLFVSIWGCKESSFQSEAEAESIAFETISIGFRIPTKGTAVIRSDSVWMAYWRDYWIIFDGYGRKTPPPTIDYSSQMVLAVFYGSGRYSGCTSHVDVIDKVQKIRDTITVTIKPLPYLGACDMGVSPIQMVVVVQSPLPVKFIGAVP
jgi:hypothetical protein